MNDFNRRQFLGTSISTATIASVASLSVTPAFATDKIDTPFSVDFTQEIAPLKPVNGSNFWAQLSNNRIFDRHEMVKALNLSTIRLHDIPLQNPGMRIVDTHMIFGRFDADTSDPKNYYFTATDDYIKRILDGGSTIIYRLGPSIEHTDPHRYFAVDPVDYMQFAKICEGIIRHYNEGWADGFQYGIEYWEIWNEPNLYPQMWNKDFGTYCKMYVTVSKYLKKKFPNLKIGGPALSGVSADLLKYFFTMCRNEGAPIDFVSWHCYPHIPEELIDPPNWVRKLSDEYGFQNAELHLNEWHYFPCSWSVIHGTEGGAERRAYWRNSPEGMNGYDAAGFCGYVLSRWQDTPLTMGNYYTTDGNWGLIDGEHRCRKPYYTFKVFGEIMKEKPVRVKTTDMKYVSLLGTQASNGQKVLMISNWKQNVETLLIKLTGVPTSGTVTIQRLDNDNNLTETKINYKDGVLKIANAPGSWVLYVKF